MSAGQPKLNSQQQRAVGAGDGPLMIVAGPGTGKTKTLTARIAHLVESGKAAPEQILALTFTKKAAEEMRTRVSSLLEGTGVPKISTFHALCHELLGSETPFVSDAQRLQIIKNLSRPKSLKSLSARELGLLISRAKNKVAIDDLDIAKVVTRYNQALKEENVHDFDDLLLETHQLLQEDEPARQAAQNRYRYILVDEFQDTNLLQYELLRQLLSHENICVIGDPYQSIYGFRGASGTIFEQFAADFTNHQAITLTTNYRSAPQVVRLSNALFADAPDLTAHSQAKGAVRAVQVLNEYSEANWIISEIQRAIGGGDFLRAVSDDSRAAHRRLSDFAVLYRSRPAALTFQKLLAESGLPYQVVGDGSPYDQPQIQAIIALLRAAAHNQDPQLEGFSNAQRRLLAQELVDCNQARPHALVERLIAILGFEPTPQLRQFAGTFVRFKDIPQALHYLDDIAERGFYDPAADAITLLTIHASKGLEFPCVFLLGAEEGILPSGRNGTDIEEERRLFYVAVTRAKDRLEITHAKNRGGEPAQISRFISGLQQDTLPRHTDPDIDQQIRRIAKRAAKQSQQSLF